jgi:hypothetical protein
MIGALTKLVIALMVATPVQEKHAGILVESIRTFGGEYSNSPIYVFQADPEKVPCNSLKALGVKLIPLKMDEAVKHYLFAEKVFACAQAEELLASETQNLVWFDNECLVLHPPDELLLKGDDKVALRPVFLKNKVGLLTDAAVDEFWGRIYKETGVKTEDASVVESFVDEQKMRAYFNCQIMSVRPGLGVFREWRRIFTKLVKDQEYQKSACPDELHQIFLHQAVLSVIITSKVKTKQIHYFSKEYSYPLNLQERLPLKKKEKKIDSLTTIIYDILWEGKPDWESIKNMDAPLKKWLLEVTSRYFWEKTNTLKSQ